MLDFLLYKGFGKYWKLIKNFQKIEKMKNKKNQKFPNRWKYKKNNYT